MRRLALALLALLSTGARAEGVEGWGRISVGGGWRWVPNWHLEARAAQAGTPVVSALHGGPQGSAAFGYGVTPWLEAAIDVFAGYDTFEVQGTRPYTAVSYGALLGAKVYAPDLLVEGLQPYLGVQVGPTLSMLTSDDAALPERALAGTSLSGGATLRLGERFGLTFDVRYLLARNFLPPLSGLNVGGVWFSVMLTVFVPPAPKRDLDVPGF